MSKDDFPPGWYYTNRANEEMGSAQQQFKNVTIRQVNGQMNPAYTRKLLNAMMDDTQTYLNDTEEYEDGHDVDAAIVWLQRAFEKLGEIQNVFAEGIDNTAIENDVFAAKVSEHLENAHKFLVMVTYELVPQ